MNRAHTAVDELTIEGKKNLFIEGLKEGYRARCTSTQPIPYFKDRYNVNEVFVESDIRFLRKEDNTHSTWERLDSYASVLTDRRVKSQRIIIQADSGYGKTFLSLHFAHDWCNHVEGSPLRDVEILIVLQLRQLGQKSSIYRAIRRFLLPKGSKIKVKDIEQVLYYCKSVLIILDGYDEYNFKNQESSDINRVIAGSMFKEINVILTGRYLPPAFDRSVTKIVGLHGFDEKARDEYIRKVVTGGDTGEQNRIKRELEENAVMSELSQVPLLFVSFAHMALKNPIKEKFHTVRKFFGSVLHCFHDHLKHKTTDPHVKEMCIMFDKDTNTEFNELALNILLSGSGTIALDKSEMCHRIGDACYEHFRRIGVLVEEEVIEYIDDDDDDADINTITKARFSHKLFCEWYASFTFSHLASGADKETFKKIMDEFDPIELQYFYRFSCGSRPSAGKNIIEKLADTDAGVQILPGCIIENRGPDTDVVPTIAKLFSKRAKITPRDTRLYQKSIVFLLNMASRLEMEVSLNLCESFDSTSVDNGMYSIILQSGIAVPPISTLNALNITTEHGRRMTEKEVNMILKYLTQCDKVILLMFQWCELPEKISTSDALVLLESRGVKVSWLDCAHCLNYSFGGWQLDNMDAVKRACVNGVSIHEDSSSYTQGLQIKLLNTASTNNVPLKLWLRKSFSTIDPTNGDIILKSGLHLPLVTTADSIYVKTEDGRQLTQGEMMGILRYATFSKQLESVSFLDCELPSSIPNGDILADIRSRGAKVKRLDCCHQINPHSGEWEIDDDETIRDICLKGVSIYKHWSEFTQNLVIKLLEVASNNEIPINLWIEESFSKIDPVSLGVILSSGLPLPKVTSLELLHIKTEEGRLITEDEILGIMKYAANSDIFRELKFQYCDMPPFVSVGDALSTFKSKGAKVSWLDCGHHLNHQSGQWEIDNLEVIYSLRKLGLGIFGTFSKHAHNLQIQLLQMASEHNIPIKGISLKHSFSKVDMKTGHIILTSGASLPHISTNWGLSVYENGRELTELDALALLYYLQNVRLLHHPQGKDEVLIDDVFEVEEGDEAGSASEDETADQSEHHIEEIVSDQTFIAYTRSTLQLLSEITVGKCCVKACSSTPVLKQKRIGTALSVTWECERGHVSKKWNSQPKVRRNFAADISLSAAILLSGNNYSKVRMLFRCMNMGMCNSNLHYYVQRMYTCPAIHEYWNGMQKDILDARKGQEVIVSGDGRNDSPGFSAQYCTYTCMDYNTNDILHVAVVDKRQVGLKSPNMEKTAFVESLQKLQENELIVKEVVTDAHPSIRAYLKQQSDIDHSSDVWHGAKNIGKKMAEVSKKAANRSLLPWIGDVTRHFWYCCSKAEGDSMKFLSRWTGLLHHVVGRHEWALGYGGGPARCEHERLPDSWKDKSIKEGSPAHIALREIVLDKRLLSSVDYYTRFRHTGRLENFQSHILAYASKRFSYSYPSYKARNLLAAIDYQKHKDRKQKVIADKPIFRRHFHKGSDRWGVVPVKEAKAYSYMAELMMAVFFKRVHDTSTQRSTVVLGEDDPRRLAPTIAPSQPPPTDELVRAHASRF